MKKHAKVTWMGSGFEGCGLVELQSETIVGASYTFNSRFNNTTGTNSEELLAAAHASDFTMKLSFILTEAGYHTLELKTICFIDFDNGELVSSTLIVTAHIADIELWKFNEFVKEANDTCPIFLALRIKVSIEAALTETPKPPC